ncbi:hypothetical protein ACQEVI_15525 [Promicromonospora sp. CA-289599]|uniref:hypothetical protein n=1 Tax=Promicromonospora sp. CA-289599 TaxID=3240014 RepID=UPI003D8B4F73
MAGSSSVHVQLRELVTAGAQTQADALRAASSLPLRDVLEALDEDFLDEHGDAGSRFLRAWLGQLGPFEQMEVAGQVADLHLLSLVDIEHSYGIAARIILESLERVTAAMADKLTGLRVFTEGPDAEVAPELADRLEALAPVLRDVNRAVAAVQAEAIENLQNP